LELSKQI